MKLDLLVWERQHAKASEVFKLQRWSNCIWIATSPSLVSSNRFRPSGKESNSSKVFLSSITKSISRISSSHFWDLDPEKYDVVEDTDDAIPKRIKERLNKVKDGKKSIHPLIMNTSNETLHTSENQGYWLYCWFKECSWCTSDSLLFFSTLNIIGLALAKTGHFPYVRNRAALFSIPNILALTHCRSEASFRIMFWVAVKILGRSCVPLPINPLFKALVVYVWEIKNTTDWTC